MPIRSSKIKRNTKETRITINLKIDGAGKSAIRTGIPFFDHMLTLFAKHAVVDLRLKCAGDLEVDAHHTVEDCGILLGQALSHALGDKRGIQRFGHAVVPMDETLVDAAIDLSGRNFVVWNVNFERPMLGQMDTQLIEEFFRALAGNGLFNLHVNQRAGHNAHHVAEACFKSVARALRAAVAFEPRIAGQIPSTKGAL